MTGHLHKQNSLPFPLTHIGRKIGLILSPPPPTTAVIYPSPSSRCPSHPLLAHIRMPRERAYPPPVLPPPRLPSLSPRLPASWDDRAWKMRQRGIPPLCCRVMLLLLLLLLLLPVPW